LAYQANLEALLSERTEHLRRNMAELESAYDCTVDAYGESLTLRDNQTGAHSKRVAVFTITLSMEMGFPPQQTRIFARGAYLHDVGKLAVPDAVLRKPARLIEDETAIMQRHCLWGYEMVRAVPFLDEVAELIHAHHERWDGKGYPRGLEREMIPVGARIIAVVNAFDCICSDQPYRPAMPFEFAVREIANYSGTQFDPQVIKAFLAVPQSRWMDIRKEVEASIAERTVHHQK
jgi:putative nucleotidyltransferase with HDIG domain